MNNPPAQIASRRSKVIAAILLLALVFNLLGFVGLAFATACGDYDCVDRSEFDTDDPARDGWLPSNNHDGNGTDTELTWLATKSFGLWPFLNSAEGVLVAGPVASGGKPTFHKTIYLQPGTYRLVMRIASDQAWGFLGSTAVVWATPPGGETFGLGATLVDDFFVFATNEITISSPGDVDFEISDDQSVKLYLDYIWVVQSTVATPTPGPGTPTATSIPAAATPIPTPTPFCVGVSPTPTAGPPQFDLTPSPTPTPIEKNFSFVDDFEYLDLVAFWKVAGTGVHVSFSTGISDAKPGALFIPYSVAPGGWDYHDMLRTALIGDPGVMASLEQFEVPISGTVYVYGWGRADFMPEGEAGHVEVWTLDADTLLWSQADTAQVSTSFWYNFNSTITSTTGLLAIAFLASRSDDATSGGLYLDDIAIYQDLSHAPTCSGFSFHTPITGGVAPPGTTEIEFPIDKPCPPDLLVPNNFWGPLIAQLTLGLDRLCAPLPAHKNLSLADKVRDGLNSPLAIYIQFLAIFFDLRIPFAVLGVIIAINVASMILEIWLRIKELIPFL